MLIVNLFCCWERKDRVRGRARVPTVVKFHEICDSSYSHKKKFFPHSCQNGYNGLHYSQGQVMEPITRKG